MAERLSVRFGRSGRDSSPRGSVRCELYRERRYSCAVFLATGTFQPTNAGRGSEARTASWNKGRRLLDGVMASRAKGQSKATRRERARRYRDGSNGREKRRGKKEKRNEERITLERVNSLVGPKAIKRSIDERTGNERRRKRRRSACREARRDEKEIGRERLSGRGERYEQAERRRDRERERERLVAEICGSHSIRSYTRTVSSDFNRSYVAWKEEVVKRRVGGSDGSE